MWCVMADRSDFYSVMNIQYARALLSIPFLSRVIKHFYECGWLAASAQA